MKKLEYMDKLFDLNPYYRELSTFKKFNAKLNFLLSRIFKRTALIDFVQYNYFLLNSNGRKRFIDQKKRKIISRELNNTDKVEIFDNKTLFNEYFSKFIKRGWIDMRKASFNEFKDFLLKYKEVLVKPVDGSFGIGIEKVVVNDNLDIDSLYEKFKNKDIIIEEIVKQNKEFSSFNESSLNTLRIVTIINNGEAHIFGAVLRIGRKGSIVDNHHSGGLSTLIDIDTGVIKTPATDYKFSKYLSHPDNNKKLIGCEIPYWKEIINTAKEAAMVIPEVRYVGWDIAVDEKGQILIIEGNHRADPDVLQRADQVGKWPDLKKLAGI